MAQPSPPPPGVSAISATGARRPITGDHGQSTAQAPTPAYAEDIDPSELSEADLKARNEEIAKRRNRGNRRRSGEDVIVNPDVGRQISGGTSATPGVGSSQQDIIEMPMPKSRGGRKKVAVFRSVDGNTYEMRTHTSKGKPIPGRELMCLFAAIRELRLGGDPMVVFDAYKLRLEDANGRKLFPLDQSILGQMPSVEEVHSLEEAFGVEEDGEDSGFGLAEDD